MLQNTTTEKINKINCREVIIHSFIWVMHSLIKEHIFHFPLFLILLISFLRSFSLLYELLALISYPSIYPKSAYPAAVSFPLQYFCNSISFCYRFSLPPALSTTFFTPFPFSLYMYNGLRRLCMFSFIVQSRFLFVHITPFSLVLSSLLVPRIAFLMKKSGILFLLFFKTISS